MAIPGFILLLASALALFHASEANYGGYGAMPAYGGYGGGYRAPPMGYGAMPYGGMPYGMMSPYGGGYGGGYNMAPPPQQYGGSPQYSNAYSSAPFNFQHAPYSPITILQSQTSTANLTAPPIFPPPPPPA